jgi:endonuclease-3 related protein
MLDPAAIAACDGERLGALIRSAGYFNVKARRLQSLCRFLLESGGVEGLDRLPTEVLRPRLLSVHGVGPETADAILLYAFGRPVFVVDAYTRRLGARLGLLGGGEPYEAVRAAFEIALGPNPGELNELHALIVRHAKALCRTRPRCRACGLAPECPGRQ